MSRTSASSSSELLRAHCAAIANEESVLREGGGKAGHERQRKMNRLPVRERLGRLLDKESPFFEIGLWAAYKMYEQWGKIPAAGAYLPVLCDKILMTKGSGLYLAGPSLVKAAIGQIVDAEELGGAQMHAEISGTVDFFEKDDPSCLKRLRSLVGLLPEAKEFKMSKTPKETFKPAKEPDTVYDLISFEGQKNYDTRDLLATVIDEGSMDEYKADYGKTIVTAYASINGRPVGIVANQRLQVRTKKEGIQMGGVIYSDSADKAARFIMDCNQTTLPIVFFQDVTGFMVGRDAEQSGIIRSGAKLVNAVSNSIVPKITVVVGGSFGAGNYAMCGKAYDPRFIVAWPAE